jgi:hypothetical protein
MDERKRFAVGEQVRVKNPGVNGVVIQSDHEPAALAEYWHTIQTEHGERAEPGCNLELVPEPATNSEPVAPRPNRQGRASLLAEVEDIIRTMPPRATIRHETQENRNWFGRVSAAVEKWDSSKSALVKEHFDLFFSNRHARETAHGLSRLLILLEQARADLRLETTQMRHPAEPALPRRLGDSLPDGLEEIERDIDYWTDQLAECSGGSERQHQVETRLRRLARVKERLPANPPEILSRKIFIGHGRSLVWLQLKAFLSDRLHLTCDEFNAEAVAGITTTDRLQTLLDDAGFAFLVMTAEDIHADNSTHARENVIHEAGLFQGRLGFKRAIILLEEGCAQFSNIHGLSHIGFPKGDLEPIFEKVRLVLEREQMLTPIS